MDSKLGHDIDENVWRSDDISIGAYHNQNNQIEIVTPNLSKAATHSNDTSYQLPNINSTFSSIKINTKIVEELKRCGFVRPSPIQATSIPLGRIGIDLIAQSKSGTGKTIVFVVCALEMIIQVLHEVPSPRVLIVAPTREIAVQIGDIIDSLTNSWKNFSCYKAIGGTKVSDNLSHLSTSQIIVGTPGRICCLLEMDFLKANAIRLLVLDECDKLMEESFQKQIDKLYNYLPANKQMIVTSATMSDEMTLFLANYMRTPALVRLNADNPALIGVMQLYHLTQGHSLDYLNFESKMEPLLVILKEVSFSQCVIFSNYQTRAKYLYDRLVAEKWTAMLISGDMTQKERLEAINAFRNHKCRILVSTDLTSRGIDVHTVNLIINLDVPVDSETYLHRIGRAGRFGSAGIAITLVGNGNDFDKFMNIINEYRLDVQQVTLPIKVNLWNSFYHDRLDHNRSLLQKNWEDNLDVSQQFCSITNNFKHLNECTDAKSHNEFEFIIHNSIDSQAFSLDDSNSNAFIKRKFLKKLLFANSKSTEYIDFELANPQANKENIDAQNNNDKICEFLNVQTLSNKLTPKNQTRKTKKSQLFKPKSPSSESSNVTSEDSYRNHLFKSAFLRPPIPVKGNFVAEINSNVAICKYLLKGCTNWPS